MLGVSKSGRAAAWRSIRYWTMNSISTSPPARCFTSHSRSVRILLGHAPAHGRRHRRRVSPDRAGGSGFRAGRCGAVGGEIRHCPAIDPRPGQRHMLPGPGIAFLIAAKALEAGGDRPGIAGGAQPHIDVVKLALAGGRGDGGDQALRQPRVVMDGRERLWPVGMQIVPALALEFGRRVIDEDQVDIGADGQLAAAELAQRHRRQARGRAGGHAGGRTRPPPAAATRR